MADDDDDNVSWWTRINGKPSEPIDDVATSVANCTITERRRYFIFGVLTNNAVWISAHGVYQDKSFTTPALTSVQFFCRHGWTLTANIRRIPNLRPDPGGNPGLLIGANTNTYDYKLHKFQGRWGMLESYDAVAQQAVATNTTIVTVRNRWTSDGIKLSTLITALKADMPNLTLVNGMHCRATKPPAGTYP